MASERSLLRQNRLLIALLLLLFVAATRILVSTERIVSIDESRTVLRTLGTVDEVVLWQPEEWPPLHNVILAGWRLISGMHPAMMRYPIVMVFMLGIVLMFRSTLALTKNEGAAWGSAFIFTAFALSLDISGFIRGYVFALALLPLAMWLTLKYFQQSNWRWGIALTVVMAAMFLLTYTSAFAFGILILYTLIYHPRKIWRWILPGILALLIVSPELLRIFNVLANDAEAINMNITTAALFQRMHRQFFGGDQIVLWSFTGLILIGAGMLAVKSPRMLIWLLISLLVIPAMLLAIQLFPVPRARYIWWIIWAGALIIGVGWSYLPYRAWRILPVAAVLLTLGQIWLEYGNRPADRGTAFDITMPWMKSEAQPGDVIVLDPDCKGEHCAFHVQWSYYVRAYFGDTMPIVQNPAWGRRVWFLTGPMPPDSRTNEMVTTNRLPSVFVGPPSFLMRLYTAPPDVEGVLFENGMRFHGADLLDENGDMIQQPRPEWFDGRDLRLRLWWSADRPIDNDYSISLQIINPLTFEMLAQSDGSPTLIQFDPQNYDPLPEGTSGWEPGKLYVEERIIDMPVFDEFIEDPTDVMMTVYQWWDGERVESTETNEDGLMPIFTIMLWSW